MVMVYCKQIIAESNYMSTSSTATLLGWTPMSSWCNTGIVYRNFLQIHVALHVAAELSHSHHTVFHSHGNGSRKRDREDRGGLNLGLNLKLDDVCRTCMQCENCSGCSCAELKTMEFLSSRPLLP